MSGLLKSAEGVVPPQFSGAWGAALVVAYNNQYPPTTPITNSLAYNVVGGLITGYALNYFGANYLMCVGGSALGAYAAPSIVVAMSSTS